MQQHHVNQAVARAVLTLRDILQLFLACYFKQCWDRWPSPGMHPDHAFLGTASNRRARGRAAHCSLQCRPHNSRTTPWTVATIRGARRGVDGRPGNFLDNPMYRGRAPEARDEAPTALPKIFGRPHVPGHDPEARGEAPLASPKIFGRPHVPGATTPRREASRRRLGRKFLDNPMNRGFSGSHLARLFSPDKIDQSRHADMSGPLLRQAVVLGDLEIGEAAEFLRQHRAGVEILHA
jgi:hypothetical protein